MERFRVSRGTVRRAIMELTSQGFLYRVQGKGTFTSQTRIRREGRLLLSLTEEIEQHGYKTRAEILRFETLVPGLKVLRALELEENERVYLIRRIRFIEDDPIALVTSYLPYKAIPNLTRQDVERSVYQALRKFHREPVMARDIFRARIADQETAALLNCLENPPAVFAAERVAYAQNNVPIEYVETVIRGGRLRSNGGTPQFKPGFESLSSPRPPRSSKLSCGSAEDAVEIKAMLQSMPYYLCKGPKAAAFY